MCRECSDTTGDPRHAAFQSFVIVEGVPLSDLKKVEAGGTGFVTQMIATTPQEVDAHAAAFVEKQPAAVRAISVAVCLN